MSTGPTNLFDLCTAIQQGILGQYTANGIAAPGLAYIYGPATPTPECDSLVVGWGPITHGTPAGRGGPMPIKGTMVSRRVIIRVWRFICIDDIPGDTGPAGQVFNSATATSDAERIMTDAYVSAKGIVAAHAAGAFRDFSIGMTLDSLQPHQAEGGISGWQAQLTVELS